MHDPKLCFYFFFFFKSLKHQRIWTSYFIWKINRFREKMGVLGSGATAWRHMRTLWEVTLSVILCFLVVTYSKFENLLTIVQGSWARAEWKWLAGLRKQNVHWRYIVCLGIFYSFSITYTVEKHMHTFSGWQYLSVIMKNICEDKVSKHKLLCSF